MVMKEAAHDYGSPLSNVGIRAIHKRMSIYREESVNRTDGGPVRFVALAYLSLSQAVFRVDRASGRSRRGGVGERKMSKSQYSANVGSEAQGRAMIGKSTEPR